MVYTITQTGIARGSTNLTITVEGTEEYESATIKVPITLTADPQPQTITPTPASLTTKYEGAAVELTIERLGDGAITVTADNYANALNITEKTP